MDLTTLLTGGALVGVLAGFWTKIKTWLLFLVSLAIEDVEIINVEMSQIVLDYLLAECKRSGLYSRSFLSARAFNVDNGDRYTSLAVEALGRSSMMFWYCRRPLILVRSTSQPKKSNTAEPVALGDSQAANVSCAIRFIRGTVDVDKLLKSAIALYRQSEFSDCSAGDFFHERNDIVQGRFFIRYHRASSSERMSGKQQSEIASSGGRNISDGIPMPYAFLRGDWINSPCLRLVRNGEEKYTSCLRTQGGNLERLYYPDEVLELIDEMKHWLTTRAWHKEKRIPWKRGWLCHGIPGTGKTALVRAFAQDLDLPVHVFELAGMSNADFISAWQHVKANTPCIALLEDFDNIFHGRRNITASTFGSSFFGPLPRRRRGVSRIQLPTNLGSPVDGTASSDDVDEDEDRDDFNPSSFNLTFDTVLNTLDGIERSDGIFTVITTNDLTKIDPALGICDKSEGLESTMSTRPGRIDRVIHLTHMLPEHKVKMAQWILSEFPDVCKEVCDNALANPNVKETPAQFQERCSRLALREKFKLRKD